MLRLEDWIISFPKQNMMWLWLRFMILGPETQCSTQPLQVTAWSGN